MFFNIFVDSPFILSFNTESESTIFSLISGSQELYGQVHFILAKLQEASSKRVGFGLGWIEVFTALKINVWNLKITQSKINIIFRTATFEFPV